MGYRKEYVHRCMMDGQMTCNFMSFLLTVFQSCQVDRRVILKNYVKWNHIYSWKEFGLKVGLEHEIARLAGQYITHGANMAKACDCALLMGNFKFLIYSHGNKVL